MTQAVLLRVVLAMAGCASIGPAAVTRDSGARSVSPSRTSWPSRFTLGGAYLVSIFLRFVLEEDVYPRAGLARGLSFALSNLLNYLLLTLFLAGLAVLGLDLTKVTIMASAFGVGIGLGLQSRVNNFVSGLILLFERPIHVGDAIEAGGIMGSVRRIGLRSSVRRTGQGVEIIVPNAQLVTERD
jgi:potassium-dependent mechanosensitive channel